MWTLCRKPHADRTSGSRVIADWREMPREAEVHECSGRVTSLCDVIDPSITHTNVVKGVLQDELNEICKMLIYDRYFGKRNLKSWFFVARSSRNVPGRPVTCSTPRDEHLAANITRIGRLVRELLQIDATNRVGPSCTNVPAGWPVGVTSSIRRLLTQTWSEECFKMS